MDEQIIEVEEEVTEQEISLENEPILMGGSGTRRVTEDGIYDIKQYENVEVDVVDGTLNITEEGTHDVTHFETANVKTTNGEKSITSNGIHDVRTFEIANVDVQPDLTTKAITENGTYNAFDDNADGYSSVSVDVPDTGAGGLYKAMLEGTAVNVIDDKLTRVNGLAYANIETLKLKKAITVRSMNGNTKIKHVILPSATTLQTRQFMECTNLIDAIVPKEVGWADGSYTSYQRIYAGCPKLIHIVTGMISYGYQIFENGVFKTLVLTRGKAIGALESPNLETLVVLMVGVTLPSQSNINASSPIAQGTGYIYVPEDDVESCKQRTNWIAFASQIKGINEQVTLSVGDTFTPLYSGSDVVSWDIVKLCSWDCTTLDSSTGAITVIDEGYLLVRGLDTDGIPVYVAYINSLEVEE